jgi:hypothetical protein
MFDTTSFELIVVGRFPHEAIGPSNQLIKSTFSIIKQISRWLYFSSSWVISRDRKKVLFSRKCWDHVRAFSFLWQLKLLFSPFKKIYSFFIRSHFFLLFSAYKTFFNPRLHLYHGNKNLENKKKSIYRVKMNELHCGLSKICQNKLKSKCLFPVIELVLVCTFLIDEKRLEEDRYEDKFDGFLTFSFNHFANSIVFFSLCVCKKQ